MVGHDNVFGLDPITFLKGRLSTWVEHGFGQGQALMMGTIPIHLIDAIPYMLGLPLQITEMVVYVFWFFMMGLSAYVLASAINPASRVFKLTSVMLYQFNFFILQAWWIGERTKFSAYVALPLVLAVFLRVYKGELSVLRGALYNSLILFIFNAGGLYGIPLFGGFFIALGVFVIFFSTLSLFRKQYNILKKLFLLTLFSFVGFIVANAYYFVPVIYQLGSQYAIGVGKQGGVSGLLSWAAEISANASYINLMRLQGIPEWYDNPQHPYAKYYLTYPILILISFLWPFLTFLTLFLIQQRQKLEIILYLFIVYLLGIFFAAGTHPPLGFIYSFFLEKVPGFLIFRTPYYKFAPAIFLATSFLIAFLIDHARGRVKNWFFICTLFLVFIYHFPYFTGDFFAWRSDFTTRLRIPEYVFEFGRWLNKEKGDNGRVLLVPPNSPDFQYSRYNWGYLSFQALPTLLSNGPVVINNDKINKEEEKLVVTLYNAIKRGDVEITKKLSKTLRISYLVLQKDSYVDSAISEPSEVAIYENALKNDSLFSSVKKIGDWEIYKINVEQTPKFFLTNKFYTFNSGLEDLDKIHVFLSDSLHFSIEEDTSKIRKLPFYGSFTKSFTIPMCLNCPLKNRPVIQFPERNILPDSPIYQLMLLFEKWSLKSNDPKTNIYNFLGLTLKRVSEINEVIIHNKVLENDFIGRYRDLLIGINKEIEKLPTLNDKVQVSQDVSHYLRAERNFLKPNLGTYVTRGQQTIMIGSLFSAIAKTEKLLAPYVKIYGETNDKIYQFTLDHVGDFDLMLGTEELKPVILGNTSFSLTVDGDFTRKILVASSSAENEWVSFGQAKIAEGFHTVRLSLPKPPSLAHVLKPIKTEFNTEEDNKCFGTSIASFENDKLYRADVTYLNDFSDNLLMFVWEKKISNINELIDAVKLQVVSFKANIEELLKPSNNAVDVLIAFCAPNLTQQLIDEQFTVKISEIINPALVFRPQVDTSINMKEVYFKKFNPTKYEVAYNLDEFSQGEEGEKPFVLVFGERFDNNWKLNKYEDTHFRMNGYANGWVVPGNLKEKLTLEYNPQRHFYYGIMVSAVFVVFALAYLFVFGKKKT